MYFFFPTSSFFENIFNNWSHQSHVIYSVCLCVPINPRVSCKWSACIYFKVILCATQHEQHHFELSPIHLLLCDSIYQTSSKLVFPSEWNELGKTKRKITVKAIVTNNIKKEEKKKPQLQLIRANCVWMKFRFSFIDFISTF